MNFDILVQKFGGTSVSTEENRLACLKHIKEELSLGFKLVVVVSAMGRKGDSYSTDSLLSLIGSPNTISKKEKDLLLSTGEIISATSFSSLLNQHNIKTIAITGGEAGILTNDKFNNADILSVSPSRITDLFAEDYDVVVVAGFQGKTEHGEVTTLGRGGSDTSATALGVALNAERVDIFTDVEGVYTADPRVVQNALALESIRYDEVCNLAHLGAKVIHPRAVQIAMTGNIPIRVRSTFSDLKGTLITNITNKFDQTVSENSLTGVTATDNLVHIVVNHLDEPDFPYDIFNMMKENDISVDLINVSTDRSCFTISKDNENLAATLLADSPYTDFSITSGFAKVSIVGANIAGVPGVMANVLEALKKDDITVYQSADSHTTIWILVEEQHKNTAITNLHDRFISYRKPQSTTTSN